MASAGAPPKAPDPNTVIQAQENANHYNASNPFGTASWARGADGRDTLTQSMSPTMQALMNQATSSAMTPRQQMQIPEGMSQLSSAILGRVGARYGLGTGNANNPTIPGQAGFPHGGGGALNTNMGKSGAPPPATGGSPMDQLSLQGNPGAAQGQMGGMGGLMGGSASNPSGQLSGTLPLQQSIAAMQQSLQGQNSPMGMPPEMQQPGGFGGPQQMGAPPTMSGLGLQTQQPGQQQTSPYGRGF